MESSRRDLADLHPFAHLHSQKQEILFESWFRIFKKRTILMVFSWIKISHICKRVRAKNTDTNPRFFRKCRTTLQIIFSTFLDFDSIFTNFHDYYTEYDLIFQTVLIQFSLTPLRPLCPNPPAPGRARGLRMLHGVPDLRAKQLAHGASRCCLFAGTNHKLLHSTAYSRKM